MRLGKLFISIFLIVLTSCCASGPDASSTKKPEAKNTNAAPAELELSGVYIVSGADENNAHPYQGTLDISNQGDVYGFNWHTNPSRPGGVGVQIGDALAATFADPSNGKGCG